MSSVKSDGRICGGFDPPGQLSVYIIPGDRRKEANRLATFEKYPVTAVLNPWKLAKAGFFYTGYRDQTKCSCCGRQVKNWNRKDNPQDAEWHEINCQFNENDPEHNIPILNEVRKYWSREQSNQSQETAIAEHSLPEDPIETTINGASGADARNQSYTNVELEQLFPCANPHSPHLRSRASRLTTFEDHATEWARNNIRATMADMANAGLYYLGVRDKVKCWYCGGGLQNWAYHDDPWFEHAKWYSTCAFVLQNKGPDYVHQVTQRFPDHLRDNSLLRSQRQSGPIDVAPIIIDPQQEIVKQKQEIQKELDTSMVAQEALKMGFTKEQVMQAVGKRLELYKRGYAKLRTLIEDLLEEPEKAEINSEDDETFPLKGRQFSNEAVQLHNLMTCKRCKKERAVVLTLPCGHIRLCEECGKHAHKCPECGHNIQSTVRTYRV